MAAEVDGLVVTLAASGVDELVTAAVREHRDCARREFAGELATLFDAMRPRVPDGADVRVVDETLQMVVRTVLRLAGLPEVP